MPYKVCNNNRIPRTGARAIRTVVLPYCTTTVLYCTEYDATHLFWVTTYPVSHSDCVWLVVVSVAGELVPLVRAVVRPCSATVHC